ncbi:hypothetical protein T439DRAFT_107938 [Meredithblackwellia eburnea MCA 4105]
MQCSGCRRVEYCSEACQKSNWKSHKNTCKEQALTNRQQGYLTTYTELSPLLIQYAKSITPFLIHTIASWGRELWPEEDSLKYEPFIYLFLQPRPNASPRKTDNIFKLMDFEAKDTAKLREAWNIHKSEARAARNLREEDQDKHTALMRTTMPLVRAMTIRFCYVPAVRNWRKEWERGKGPDYPTVSMHCHFSTTSWGIGAAEQNLDGTPLEKRNFRTILMEALGGDS